MEQCRQDLIRDATLIEVSRLRYTRKMKHQSLQEDKQLNLHGQTDNPKKEMKGKLFAGEL